MKDTVALAVDGNVFLSQHLGDLENTHAFSAFAQAIDSLSSLYEAKPDVQHHYAHILACMAENQKLDFCEKSNFSPVLGIAWDGTGYGPDGTIWGGECLLVKGDGFRRIAHLRPFRLPGGEAAVREPRRSAFGLLHECFGKKVLEWEWLPSVAALNADEQRLFGQMCARGVNAPVTTSAGRLFDGVASLLGLCQKSSFEGEAAMALEFAANGQSGKPYSFSLSVADGEVLVVDWQPLLEELLTDISRREPVGQCAARFHSTLAEIALAVAQRVDVPDVALTGGCFQNRLLSETTIERLRAAGFHPIWHKQVPPNDGGIALGQVVWGMMGRRDGRMAGR